MFFRLRMLFDAFVANAQSEGKMCSSGKTGCLHVYSAKPLDAFRQMCHSVSCYAKAGNANFVMVSTGYFSLNSSGSQISWPFAMGYLKLKFRGDGNKAFPCFRPF